jgi:O-antigen ligase
VLVLVSTFNPSYRELSAGERVVFIPDESAAHWPSTARPDLSLRSLWFFAATYLAAFNLIVVVQRRWMLRVLFVILIGNALLLAVLGTTQKLLGSEGLFFGGVPSPQEKFFASFLYHNHWGAFAILMSAVSLGLAFHFARRGAGRDLLHSPALAALAVVVFLTVSIPLSASRSSTLLITVLILGAFVHWLARSIKTSAGERPLLGAKIVLGAVALFVLIAFAFDIARPVIATRAANTFEQIANARADSSTNSRVALYRDTWNMAREKLAFGWGMGSYPTVFYTRNTQRYTSDGFERHFHDAHSDWLQSFSEVGLVGSALLAFCSVVPLGANRRVLTGSPLVLYPLSGCALVVVYAALEFPFGNRAVVGTWWVCLFGALQYARLSERRESQASEHTP